MTVIIFLIILAALVFVHELGHFVAAKISGIRVDEFALGFPPKIFSFTYGETKYSLNLIPFGGFVKIFGENPDQDSIEGPDKARSFYNKPKSLQAFVLVAGVLFNILFAWVLISLGFMIGMSVPSDYSTTTHVQNPRITIVSTLQGKPADKAGLRSGDVVLDIHSGRDIKEIQTVNDVQQFIGAHPQQVVVHFVRGNEEDYATVTPQTGLVTDDPYRPAIGVALAEMGILKLPFFSAFTEGAKLTIYFVQETAIGIYTFLSQALTGHGNFSEVAGPVGIAGLVGEATALGIVYLLSFTAIISINLAIINLIPFPALDGGRLLMVLIEKIKGSPINPKFSNIANLVGFVILIGFMIAITFHDVFRLFLK